MEITLHSPLVAEISDLWIALVAGLAILWLLTLGFFLKRTDLEATERLVWTIVLCTLNVVGMVLYWMIAPPCQASQPKVLSEKDLKERFNRGEG